MPSPIDWCRASLTSVIVSSDSVSTVAGSVGTIQSTATGPRNVPTNVPNHSWLQWPLLLGRAWTWVTAWLCPVLTHTAVGLYTPEDARNTDQLIRCVCVCGACHDSVPGMRADALASATRQLAPDAWNAYNYLSHRSKSKAAVKLAAAISNRIVSTSAT
jgi:hypothetical protein